jgi:hypothetical protein
VPEGLKERPRHALSHELFVRAMGGVALLAWLSLHAQLAGLFGPNGLAPIEARVAALVARDGPEAMFEAPSVFFLIGGSLASLEAVVLLGELAAGLLALGVLPGPLALLSFALYLSFVSLGWPFLPLQWDTLLCEALVLAALVGRWRGGSRPASLRDPDPVVSFVAMSLVTRLMLASGLAKLLSGDPTWRDGSALAFHHWTQPLPSPLAPWLHALPAPLHALATYATLALELGVPCLVLLGPRARRVSAALSVGLMLAIGLSGNYGFFGLLTAALCLPLVDDAAILRGLPWLARVPVAAAPARRRLPALAYGALGGLAFAQSMGLVLPAPVQDATDRVGRLHLAGHYGLFAVMTTDRPELLLEASLEAASEGPWEAYDFAYKPGDPTRGPRWCVPHLPRLDWMLWFAALGASEPGAAHVEPWILRLVRGLLEDRRELRGLVGRLPLGGARPRALRLVRARYRFASEGEAVWTVEERQVLAVWRRRAD